MPRPLQVVGAYLQLLLARGYLDAYTGNEPASATSTHFKVQLLQAEKVLSPMVYMTASPDGDLDAIHPPSFCNLHGGHFCNRTISWVEFGQDASDTTRIIVSRVDGERFPDTVRALPVSYGLNVEVSEARDTVTVSISGQRRHFALSFGAQPSSDPASSFTHGMFVFVGGRDPEDEVADALVFGPGVHHLPGDGIVQLDRAVVLKRGAWVQGRFNVTRNATGPVYVLGHGIMEGSRFKYHGSAYADYMRFVDVQYDRPLVWDGATLVSPQGHALFAPPNSDIRGFRMLGWLFNEDGIWIGSNTTLRESFLRTNDDSIRFYAGALDGFRNLPPPTASPAQNIHVEDCVVMQSFNGAVLQLGWENMGITDSVVDGLDIIGAEWYWELSSEDPTQRTNNAVVNIKSPEYDLPMTEHHRNVTIRNVRVDQAVGRFVGLGFFGTPKSTVHGFTIENVELRESLQWLQTGPNATAGSNYLVADDPDEIVGVAFRNVCMAGQPVQEDSEWALLQRGVQGATYSRDSAACVGPGISLV